MPQILACAIKNHSACARLSKQSDWDTTCTLFKTLLFWGGWQHTAPENYTAIHYLNIKHSSTCFNHVPRNSSTVPLCSANPSWLSLLEKYILFFYFFFSKVEETYVSQALQTYKRHKDFHFTDALLHLWETQKPDPRLNWLFTRQPKTSLYTCFSLVKGRGSSFQIMRGTNKHLRCFI